jgi:hypothetical protein
MRRRFLAVVSAISLLLSVTAGIAWLMTLRFAIDDPATKGGIVLVASVSWLGWASLLFLGTTAGLLWRRSRDIRISEERLRRGLCPSCGYALIGNTSGVCPECGTPVAKNLGVKA